MSDLYEDAGSQDFQPKDRKHLDYCKHCGIPFSKHLGVTPTCAQHMEAQKKLHAIYALVQANRHYTAPEAFELVCEKIMELKDKEDE